MKIWTMTCRDESIPQSLYNPSNTIPFLISTCCYPIPGVLISIQAAYPVPTFQPSEIINDCRMVCRSEYLSDQRNSQDDEGAYANGFRWSHISEGTTRFWVMLFVTHCECCRRNLMVIKNWLRYRFLGWGCWYLYVFSAIIVSHRNSEGIFLQARILSSVCLEWPSMRLWWLERAALPRCYPGMRLLSLSPQRCGG